MQHLRRLTSHPLFSGSLVMVGGNMLTNVVNYLYHLVMGRLMGPVEYGVLASLYSILYIISIVPMSTSFAMVKFVSSAKNEKELSSVYLALKKFVFKLALVGMLVVLLLS